MQMTTQSMKETLELIYEAQMKEHIDLNAMLKDLEVFRREQLAEAILEGRHRSEAPVNPHGE